MVVATPGSAFAALPHGGYSSTTNLCANCHTLHRAPSDRYLFSVAATASTSGEIAACYSCHDGAGAATNVKTGSSNSFALASGHRVENATETTGASYDLTNRCSACHSPHSDYATNRRLPVRSVVTSSGTYAVTGANTTWCLACHNDANDWYKSTTTTAYPSMATPTRDASGYPVIGTFPGKTVYNDTSKNRHAAIPSGVTTDPMLPAQKIARVTGDCLWCHVAHRASSTYDSLPTTFSAPATTTVALDRTRGDYAAACFTCHGGGSWEASGAVNIKQFAVKTPDDSAVTSGHRIKTTGAALPLNAPLPCYDCHNPHGSTRNNKMMLADTLGQSLDATVSGGVVTTAAGRVREFCFTCHSTSDATAKVWDSAAGSYTSATSSMLVQGLRRDGTLLAGQTRPSGYSLDQNYLKLKPLGGTDAHSQSSTKSCYDCHGKNYNGAGAPNVHAPTMGVSNGGVACYGCHSEYQPMEDNTGSVTGGALRLGSYHHVMGSVTNDGDFAPASTAYPTSTTDVYCVSCHVDHDKFNANKSGNLRATLGSAPATAATDYNSSTGGVCLGCHTTSLTKDFANQRDDGSRKTPTITIAGYAGKPHDYVASSTYGDASTFRANCAKCHSDELTKTYQASTNKFGTHISANRRILSALGGTVADAMEEAVCFKCHSGANTTDYYAAASMDSASRAVNVQFSLAYKHSVATTSGVHRPDESQSYISANKHIECEDCHNVHAAGATNHTVGGVNGNAVGTSSPLYGVWGQESSRPTNWVEPTYSLVPTATKEYQVCFKCHSGANTAYTAGALGANPSWSGGWGGTGVDLWTNVALEFNTNNRSFHPVLGPTGNNQTWLNSKMNTSWRTVGQTMTCSDCHQSMTAATTAAGPHGSSVKRILRGYWPTNNAAGTGTYYALGDQSDPNLLCGKCHNMANFESWTDAHGGQHDGGWGGGSYLCVDCHVTVPHGSKLAGLVGDGNGNMPSRYARANTEGNTLMRGYSGTPTGFNSCGCTDTHSSTNGDDW